MQLSIFENRTKQSWLIVICCIALCLFMFIGCGAEFSRRLNQQNLHAATLIQKEAVVPAVKGYATDIVANAQEEQARNGKPNTPVPYSPEASAQARADSKHQRESGWWQKFKGFFAVLGALPIGAILETAQTMFPSLGIIGLLGWGWTQWKRLKEQKKVKAGYLAANNIMKTIRDDGTITVDTAKEILKESQRLYGVADDVRKDLQEAWAKRELDDVKDHPFAPLRVEPENVVMTPPVDGTR